VNGATAHQRAAGDHHGQFCDAHSNRHSPIPTVTGPRLPRRPPLGPLAQNP
jgi:hypothetical protein